MPTADNDMGECGPPGWEPGEGGIHCLNLHVRGTAEWQEKMPCWVAGARPGRSCMGLACPAPRSPPFLVGGGRMRRQQSQRRRHKESLATRRQMGALCRRLQSVRGCGERETAQIALATFPLHYFLSRRRITDSCSKVRNMAQPKLSKLDLQIMQIGRAS